MNNMLFLGYVSGVLTCIGLVWADKTARRWSKERKARRVR